MSILLKQWTLGIATKEKSKGALELIFDDIDNVPVADASSVSNWNTFFDLPTYGTPFTSVVIDGNTVKLYGGTEIALKGENSTALFMYNEHIISIHDYANCVIAIGSYFCFWCHSFTSIIAPVAVSVGDAAFAECISFTHIELPSCINLGSSVDIDGIFADIFGVTVSVTFPSALMTCNGGNPDGDIQYLQTNYGNIITIIQV